MKLGLFELQIPKEQRDDWLFIIDTTFGHSAKQCLLILGIPYQKWLQKRYSDVPQLQYHDVQVLSLNVLESTKGTIVASILNDLTDIVGQPLQIIADHRPDLNKADATPRRRKTQGKRTKQELNCIAKNILKLFILMISPIRLHYGLKKK